MNKKMQACFSGHVIMHSLFGLGLGILLVSLIPSLDSAVLGLIIMVVAIILDAMRKG